MYIKVSVRAGAKKETLSKLSPELFEISVREKPIRNLANRRVIELIAFHFSVPVGKVRIISGHRSPSKILSVAV